MGILLPFNRDFFPEEQGRVKYDPGFSSALQSEIHNSGFFILFCAKALKPIGSEDHKR